VECADADTIAALISNELDDNARASIATHAASCENCHRLLEGLVDDIAPRDNARIGRYVIGDRLGAGGMGIVFAADDTELHRRVAVKLLRTDSHAELGTQGRERLLREARVLARLSHPNVVTVFDVGTHENDLFVAMELVEGGNFNAWLRSAPRTRNEILDRLIEAGRGLAAAHDAGIVHRDVKPDNVLIGRDGRARMTDFGLARIESSATELPTQLALGSDLTRTGAMMGTPLYMAPEQLRGETGPRADQWSFCAMLYELVGGVRPFEATDLAARSEAIADGKLAPARMPAWVRAIAVRGLRPNPKERWPSMHEVVHALVRGRGRRTRILRWSLAAFVLALGAITIIAIRHREPPMRQNAIVGHWTDTRPGCNCPYSSCETKCVSECNAEDFEVGQPVPGVSLPDRQEALAGASLDGNTILYVAGKGCSQDRLFLAKRRGTTFESVDITDRLDLARVKIFEGCCTLAPDGASMIIATADNQSFVRVKLPDFAITTDEFANLSTRHNARSITCSSIPMPPASPPRSRARASRRARTLRSRSRRGIEPAVPSAVIGT